MVYRVAQVKKETTKEELNEILKRASSGELEKYVRSQFPANDARSDMLTQLLGDPATLAGFTLFMLIILFLILTGLPMIGGALGAKVLAKE